MLQVLLGVGLLRKVGPVLKRLVSKILTLIFMGFICIMGYAYFTETSPEPLLRRYVGFLRRAGGRAVTYSKRGYNIVMDYGKRF